MVSEPRGVSLKLGAVTTGTVRYIRCQQCGAASETRFPDLVPASFYNAVRDYVRAAAGDDFVLLPVATLNAMGEELEALRRGNKP